MTSAHFPCRPLLVVLALSVALGTASAEVEIKPVNRPPAEREAVPAADGVAATPGTPAVDLGEQPAAQKAPAAAATPAKPRPAARGSKTGGRVALPAPAPAPQRAEHVEFRDRPVPVALAVGKERMVLFPGPVQIQVPSSANGLLDVQVIGRTAYLTALAPLEKVRLAAQDLTIDQRWYPLDIVASEAAGAGLPIEIHPPGEATAAGDAQPDVDAPDMVTLTRFAAHALYAPRRLMPATPGVRQVPVNPAPALGLYRGRRIETTPIGAWRGGNLYVTAVRFTNLEPAPVELDLNELRGQWLAATAQHLRIGPAGTERDTTAVYLICDRPFEACR
jgi:integrating conjugative element protein (TIGR03749 family)